jgi:hypothetical protein
MKNLNKILQRANIVLGLFSIVLFVFNFVVLIRLQPKMVVYETLTEIENSLLTGVGLGLMVILLFYVLTLLQIAWFVKYAEKLTFFSLFLIIVGVLSLLAVFSDVALLSDIHKQYTHGLSQPEWLLVYPIMIAQFVVTILFTIVHFTGVLTRKQVDEVSRDVSIFLVVQFVGLVCGLLGLAAASLGFLFPRAWSLTLHTVLGGLVLIFPYALALGYWIITKLTEKDRQWFDEKQQLDIGRSAFLTIILVSAFMIALFIVLFNNLDGVIRFQWLPLYLFMTLFLFSAGNIYYSSKA